MLLLALGSRLGTFHLTIDYRIEEETLLLLCIVHTQSGADREVLERGNTQVGITEHTPLGVFVILIIREHAHRVFTL